MLYVKEGALQIDPSRKILKADELAAYLNAQEIIALAKKKAEEITTAAKQAYEEEKKRGFEEGMEEGNEKISELMIDTVDKSVKNFEEFENDVIDVVMKALEKIIGQLDQKEIISKVVRNALETVRSQKRVTLMVAQTQVEDVREQLDKLLSEYPTINFIDIQTDKRIKPGGCILETEMGVVDATIDVQMRAIRSSLMRSIK